LIGIEGLYGTYFVDALYGDSGANTILALGGDDRLDGRGGADLLIGGAGSDTFAFRAGEANGDRITDFACNGSAACDRLDLLASGAGASFVQLSATTWRNNYSEGSEVIALTNGAPVHTSDYAFM
jgi:Ca2+-binding RTX toxin-like protein